MGYEDRDGHEFCEGEIEESRIKKAVREGMREMRETGEELVTLTDELHAQNERHAKHLWDALHSF